MAFEGQGFAYGSGKERVIFWKSLARSLGSPDGGSGVGPGRRDRSSASPQRTAHASPIESAGAQLDQDKAAALAALVLDTLPAYVPREQQAAVDAAVDAAAARHPAFLQHLTVALLKAAAARPAAAAAQRLLAWSCALLAALPEGAGRKAAAKIVEAQGGLFETIAAAADADGNPAARQAASRHLRRMLLRAPGLAGVYAEVAAAAAPSGGGAGAIGALLDASTSPRQLRRGASTQPHANGGGAAAPAPAQAARAESAAAAHELGLKLLCDALVPAKERPAPGALAALAPLLERASPAEWAARIQPAFARALRRTPEPAMATLAACLRLSRGRLDLGDDAAAAGTAELVSLILQQLRAKEAVRPAAYEALAAIAAACRSPGALDAAVGSVIGLLDGSAEGRIKAAGERVALAHALAALAVPVAAAAAPGAPRAAADAAVGSLAPAAAAAAGFCAGFIKEEPTEEVRAALAACLAAWLPAASPAPPAAGGALAALLADAKEAPRRAALRALGALAAAAPAALEAVGPEVAAPLAKIVKEGASKAAARADGLAALAAAAAAGGGAAAAALEAAGGAGGLAASPLLAAATVAKLAGAEAAPAGPLAAALLLRHGDALAAAPGARDAAARLLAAALLHHSREARGAALRAALPVAAAAAADGGLAAALANALRHWENDSDGALAFLAAPDGSAAVEEGRAEGTYSWRFGRALAALAPRAPPCVAVSPLGAPALAALLLAAHHPAAARGARDGRRAWREAAARCPALLAQLEQGAGGLGRGGCRGRSGLLGGGLGRCGSRHHAPAAVPG